jgi:transposase
LKAALPVWLPFYEQKRGPLADSVRQKLLRISPATIDRLLKKTRARYPGKGLCGTRPGRLLKIQIPVRTDHHDIDRPGYLEADTVAHGGTSMAGSFIWSTTFTDIFSQWTENRAVWNKGSTDVLREVKGLEQTLPFEMLGFDVDNGSEFLTYHLWRYLLDRPRPISMTRSRAYRKNDQAHVEQKNWTHVRQLLGYQRLEQPELIPLINDLYQTWAQFHNFFCPTLKLLRKTRKGSKSRRTYANPQTPYQRLLECPHLTAERKQKLSHQYQQLNPFELQEQIEQKLKTVFNKANAR